MTIHDMMAYRQLAQARRDIIDVLLDDNLGYGVHTVEMAGLLLLQSEYVEMRPMLRDIAPRTPWQTCSILRPAFPAWGNLPRFPGTLQLTNIRPMAMMPMAMMF